MVPSAVSPSKRRKFQANDDPPLVLTPEKSTPPPLARKPVESIYKRRRLLNSKKGNNNIVLCDQEGVVHDGGARADIEDLRKCDFTPSKGHDYMQQQQQNDNDPFHKVTREACSVGNDSKYRKSITNSRKQNYTPKINDRTKRERNPKPKKKVNPRKNMHESRMPQPGQVIAEESIPGPVTPESLDEMRLTHEPLDKKRTNLDGCSRDDCATLAPNISWKTRSTRTSCRRALDFIDNVEDENASILVSKGSVANFSDVSEAGSVTNVFDVSEAGSVANFSDVSEAGSVTNVSAVSEAGSVANFSGVNEANELMWWSLSNKLEVEDFGSCIEMREIIREHKETELSSKKAPANIDLKGVQSKIFRGYPKRKRSINLCRPKMHKAVLNVVSEVPNSSYADSVQGFEVQELRTHNTTHMQGFDGLERLENNALIPYGGRAYLAQMQHMQGFDGLERLENNALIPYGGRADLAQMQELVRHEREADYALIPRREPKRKPKASVPLCPNTIRVWNLLMESDAGLEGLDEPTKEWMKDETKQLSDRIDVFISRMNLFQGDRRFSHWGGSVLDSVVGVLLTQNVTDVLSSSAFMNLAAKYPSKLRRRQKKYGEISRNEKAENSHQPQDSPQNADMEDLSRRDSVSESSTCSCSGHPGRFLLPDLNLPPNLDSSYANLVLGVSSPPDCRSSPSTSSELTHTNLQLCVQGLEPKNKDTDEQSQKGASESWKTNADDYWYTMGWEIAIAKAKMRGKKSKIASRNNKVASELKDPARKSKEKQKEMPDNRVNWDELRTTHCTCKPRSYDSLDAVDWEAVHRAPFEEVSKVIEERGMNNLIAGRIKDIVDRLLRDHGSLDLEWLRDVPPIKAKDYLRSIGGIGLKSVECIRLLALEHKAFAVDTNIGRIAVRLGWVPLKPLPDGILIHLLDKYPLVDKIQQYLWPRLQGLSQRKLYELHYHMITFGKIFCKKRRPNCNACPMKGECRHFASEYASEKLKLPAPDNEAATETLTQLLLEGYLSEPRYECEREPYVDFPSSPEPICVEPIDIEDLCSAEDDEIPVLELNTEAFRQNLQMELERRNCMQLDIILNTLASATHESASIPMKKVRGLRTEHHVYELEDGHPSLEGFVEREHDDPSPYLVKIWTSDEMSKFLDPKIEEHDDQTVLGTILIPCKTANGGCFPLNGTYFQTNEVFADYKTSRNPIAISKKDLWNRPERLLYCGTGVASIFTGSDLQTITYCFWRGFVCTRGYDRDTRETRPMARVLHKMPKNKKEDLDE